MSLFCQIVLIVWVAGMFLFMEAFVEEQYRLSFYGCNRPLDRKIILIICSWPVIVFLYGLVLLSEKIKKENQK